MSLRKLAVWLVLATSQGVAQTGTSVRDFDFQNWTFPFVRGSGAPGRPLWLRTQGLRSLTVRDGRHDFPCPVDPSGCGMVRVDKVKFAHLKGLPGEVALVTVWYHSGGTANWGYIYIVGGTAGRPTVLGLLRRGSRADMGIREFEVNEGDLVVTLSDPDKRAGDCCSEGTITVRYRRVQTARGAMFVEVGKRVFADVPLGEKPLSP